jgi:hypothetical protein
MELASFLRLMGVTVFQVKVWVHGVFGFSPFGGDSAMGIFAET